MSSSRQYDIVLLGATGYTGKLTAEYITESLPTNLKWAVAGRSESKLKSLVSELKSLNSTRKTPDILPVNLNLQELTTLAKKTKVILNTIGPYFLYSTPVVQACAENGTHYLDVTGETPWVREIIQKFEPVAKKSGAIIIPEIGVESAPSDMLAYVATKLVRDVWDCGVMDIVASIHEFKTSGASGGTLATGLGLLDHYSIGAVREAFNNPFVLSPVMSRDHRHTKFPEPNSYSRTASQKFFGVWEYPFLGTLTTSITASPNMAVVHRSAGINPLFYGFNFTYEEYMRVSTPIIGYLIHAILSIFTFIMLFPPFRMIAKALVTKAGSGPSKESGKNDYFEIRAVAVAEQLNQKQRKAMASFRYDGNMYTLTAVTLAEGAVALLGGLDALQKKYGAGFLTPSCLGDKYVQGLEKAGVKFSVKQLGDTGSK